MDETELMEDDDNDNSKPLLLMIKANAFNALTAGYRPRVHREQSKLFY